MSGKFVVGAVDEFRGPAEGGLLACLPDRQVCWFTGLLVDAFLQHLTQGDVCGDAADKVDLFDLGMTMERARDAVDEVGAEGVLIGGGDV